MLCVVIILLSAQTTSTLLVFLLAMVLYPEAQAKAHAEIDRVVGKDRLPGFDDRPALPYVEAILRETLRWHPVFPLGPSAITPILRFFLMMYQGAPSATTTSDIYKGYFIPKGWYHTVLAKVANDPDYQGLLCLKIHGKLAIFLY